MARRKKYSKRSSKCPEPLNTMIDLAAGLTMGAVAAHMEKKYHYSKKGKINPYTVSAMGLATGRMKSTKDILRTGAVLGALGSFDVEADDETSYRTYIPEDPVFNQIRETKTNDNRYAWRLNCVDGSELGIFPEDFETREEYNEAIAEAREDLQNDEDCEFCALEQEGSTESVVVEDIWKLRVSRLDNGVNLFYLTDNPLTKIGDTVTVPTEHGSAKGIVIGVEEYIRDGSELSFVLSAAENC